MRMTRSVASVALLAPLLLTGGATRVLTADTFGGDAAVASDPPALDCDSQGYGAARRLPHPQRQASVVSRLLAHRTHARFTIERARASRMGVVALVAGDTSAAQRALPQVPHVVSWTAHYLSDYSPSMRMSVALTSLLDPTSRRVAPQLATVDSNGRAYVAVWAAGSAVVIAWKAPIPAAVRRLAGIERDGAEVRVVTVRFSQRDVQRASSRLTAYLDQHRIQWSTVSGCQTFAGLQVGVEGDASHLGVSLRDLRTAAGMPVEVEGGVVVGF